MNVEILQEKENPFFNRKEILVRVEHEGKPTPKKEEAIRILSEHFKVEEGKIELQYIFSETGRAATKIKAYISN